MAKPKNRISINYFDGINSAVQSSLAKRTELAHMENARSPIIGVLEKRRGQVKVGTAVGGAPFISGGNFGLAKFETSNTTHQGIFRVSIDPATAATPTGAMSPGAYEIGVKEDIKISEGTFKGTINGNTRVVTITNELSSVYSLNTSNEWVKLTDASALNLIGAQYDFSKVDSSLVMVNGKNNNSLISADGVTVIDSSEAGSLYNSPSAHKVAFYKNRIYLGDFTKTGIRYKTTILRSSFPMGIVALLNGDSDGTTTIPVTDINYIYAASGMNSYDVYRGGTLIKTITVTSVQETTITISPLDNVAAASGVQIMSISADGRFFYVTNQNVNTISVYSRDTSTGVITAASPATVATGVAPWGIIISPDGTSVYIANNTDNTISMYSRSTATGVLTPLGTPTIACGSAPREIIVSPDGMSVYVVNWSGNTISQYSRNTSTGALTALGTPTVATDANPTSITISSNGASVYVANYGSTTVSQYSRNTSTGALTPLAPASISCYANPRGIAISPDGQNVYVANTNGGIVSIFDRNITTGLLTAPSIPTVPAGASAQGITVSHDGNFVYVVNASDNTISTFTRNMSTGALIESSPVTATGSTPRKLSISPDGTTAYVTNNGVFTISQYSRNTTTGVLSPLAQSFLSSDEIWVSGTFNGEKQYRWVNNATSIGQDVKQYDTFKLTGGDEDAITILDTIGNILLIANKNNLLTWNDYTLQGFDMGIGCVSKTGSVKLMGSMFFLHYTGVYSTSGTTPTLLSRKIERYITGATKAGLENAAAGVKGQSVFFAIGDVSLYNPDGSDWKTLPDVCLEYSVQDRNWYIHTNVPAERFITFINTAGTERLLMEHSSDGKYIKEFLVGNTDDGQEIFFRADTQEMQLISEFEYYSSPTEVFTELDRGSQLKTFISLDGEDFYEIQGASKKGINKLRIGTDNNNKDLQNNSPVCRKVSLSFRDSSKQICRLNQVVLIHSPTTTEDAA